MSGGHERQPDGRNIQGCGALQPESSPALVADKAAFGSPSDGELIAPFFADYKAVIRNATRSCPGVKKKRIGLLTMISS